MTLKLNSTGPEVAQLQNLLYLLEYPIVPSGTYDIATVVAVKTFQQSMGLGVDGRVMYMAGETWPALVAAVKAVEITPSGYREEKAATDRVDDRSEKVIATLHPRLHAPACVFVEKVKEHLGITIKLISGARTDAEQNALYAKGRTAAGPRVTNAKAGFSNHNFGIAFDIGVFVGGAYVPESSSYKKVSPIAKELGFEWGGDWTSLKDEPHYQFRPMWAKKMREGEMLAELRRRKAAGIDAFA